MPSLVKVRVVIRLLCCCLLLTAGRVAQATAPQAPTAAQTPKPAPTPTAGPYFIRGVVGEIRAFAFGDDRTRVKLSDGTTIPSLRERGWLSCEGQELAISEFPELGAVLAINRPDGKPGSTWGAAARGISFNVPDLRGLFLRGFVSPEASILPGNGAGEPEVTNRRSLRGDMPQTGDQGNTAGVGSYQDDQLQVHEHLETRSSGPGGAGDPGLQSAAQATNRQDTNVATRGPQTPAPNPLGIVVRAGKESRPKNVQVMFCIYVGRVVKDDIPQSK